MFLPFALSLITHVASLAPPLPPLLHARQSVNLLSIDFAPPSYNRVYATSGTWKCMQYPILVGALNPPVSLDAIASPFSRTQLAAQTVVAHVGNYTTDAAGAETEVKWTNDVPVGEQFVMRVVDAVGNVIYSSPPLTSLEGTKGIDDCVSTAPVPWRDSNAAAALWVVLAMIGFVLLLASAALWGTWSGKRLAAKARQLAAAEGRVAGQGEAAVPEGEAIGMQPQGEAAVEEGIDEAETGPEDDEEPPALTRTTTRETGPPGYEESMLKGRR
ncbi:hypothetical protein JCM1840_001246 [Sporobolomyces johnsonii]